MKLGILIGTDYSLDFESQMYGVAITYWQRRNWQVGVRFSLLLGSRKYGVRFSTYACPSISRTGIWKTNKCTLPLPPNSWE
jgi:hypothetical protein